MTRVLAVGAHPDDLEVGAGGTLARLAREGAEVTLAVLSVPGDSARRVREARAGARALGCGLRLVTHDGRHVEDLKSYDVEAALARLVGELAPRLVLAPGLGDDHQDHVIVAQAAQAVLECGAFDFWRYATSSRAPHNGRFRPSLFVDITPTLDAKLASIAAHESQFGRPRRDPRAAVMAAARAAGRIAGVRYAEAFEAGRVVV